MAGNGGEGGTKRKKDKSDKIDGYKKPETQRKEGIEKQLRERKGEIGRPGKEINDILPFLSLLPKNKVSL